MSNNIIEQAPTEQELTHRRKKRIDETRRVLENKTDEALMVLEQKLKKERTLFEQAIEAKSKQQIIELFEQAKLEHYLDQYKNDDLYLLHYHIELAYEKHEDTLSIIKKIQAKREGQVFDFQHRFPPKRPIAGNPNSRTPITQAKPKGKFARLVEKEE